MGGVVKGNKKKNQNESWWVVEEEVEVKG